MAKADTDHVLDLEGDAAALKDSLYSIVTLMRDLGDGLEIKAGYNPQGAQLPGTGPTKCSGISSRAKCYLGGLSKTVRNRLSGNEKTQSRSLPAGRLGEFIDSEGNDKDDVDSNSPHTVEDFDWVKLQKAISEIASSLLVILESDLGKKLVTFAAADYEKIFDVVVRFSQTLGPVAMIFSIATGFCFHDRRISKVILQRFRNNLREVDFYIEQLTCSLAQINRMLTRANILVNQLMEKWSDEISVKLNKIMDMIEGEKTVASIRLSLAESTLENLKEPIYIYKRKMIRLVGVVYFLYAMATIGLHLWNYIDQTATVVGMLSGMLPLLYTHYPLSARIQELLNEIVRREQKNAQLRGELDVLSVRFEAIRNSARKQT